ncbi:speckle-type POZ protein B-like [Belonocnema kinseyi]|uniref:speckle-type POZ protein B-like n=1 Tax=Belonocnema kinseyi TaxID=2817044 RepID=UPI00143D0DB9|nr:speckle-type POZ protein B-like [Belonocnema kinseyi]
MLSLERVSLVDVSHTKRETERPANEKPITRYVWWVDYINASDDSNEGLKWHTTEFPMESNNQFEWKLSMYSPGLSLYIENVRTNEEVAINIEASFSITNALNEILYTKSIVVSGKISESQSYGFTEFIKTEEVLDFLIDDRFKILCELRDLEKEIFVSDSIYANFMKNDHFNDIEIIINDYAFRANKLVLAANSPVFERIFSHNMKESLSKQIEIKEMDREVFEEVIRFMYLKKVNLRNLSVRLLIAANRYEMEALKSICEKELITAMTSANVISFLTLADQHNSNNLKRNCFSHIMINFKVLVETTDYEELSVNCPRIILELNREIAKKCTISFPKD